MFNNHNWDMTSPVGYRYMCRHSTGTGQSTYQYANRCVRLFLHLCKVNCGGGDETGECVWHSPVSRMMDIYITQSSEHRALNCKSDEKNVHVSHFVHTQCLSCESTQSFMHLAQGATAEHSPEMTDRKFLTQWPRVIGEVGVWVSGNQSLQWRQ